MCSAPLPKPCGFGPPRRSIATSSCIPSVISSRSFHLMKNRKCWRWSRPIASQMFRWSSPLPCSTTMFANSISPICAAIAEEPCSNRNSIVPKTGNTWQRNCAVCFNSSYIWCSPPTTVRRPTPAFSKPALSSEMTGPLVEFQCMKAGRKGNLDSCRQTPLYEHCHDHACAAHG